MTAPRKSRARDIAVVALYELQEALRSRRVLILVLLFVGGAVAGTLGFIDVIESFEAGFAQVLAVPQSGKPGAVTAELMRSPEFHRMLGRLVRDDGLARELVSLPPLALFYGWLALNFTPVLIILSSAEAVSAELATGSARFSLLRTSRLSFSVGKLIGQTLLMIVGIALGAIAVWITGFFQLASFESSATALWLALLSLRIAVYAFAHVGLAVGLSHLTRSVPLSRVLAIFALMVFAALFALGNYNTFVRDHAPGVADTLLTFLPRTHMLDLWRPALVDRLPSIAMLVALGVVYFAGGYAYRAREGHVSQAPALLLDGVCKAYAGRVALAGLDLSAPRGAITGLIGPNGAGKTTCFGIVGGLLEADSGRVDVLGHGRFDPERQSGALGLLPQDAELPGHARVEGLLRYLAELQGFSRAGARTEATRVLDLLALRDRAGSQIRELSHGMRRRVAVAQTLLGDPELVVLDEPTSGLDPHLVAAMRDVLRGQRGRGRSLVVSSHVLTDLEAICDHVVFIEAGRAIKSGPLAVVTGRSRRVRFSLAGPISLDGLRARLPDLRIELRDGHELEVETPQDDDDVAALNRRVLRELLTLDAGVLEIRLGHSLEEAYLDERRKVPKP